MGVLTRDCAAQYEDERHAARYSEVETEIMRAQVGCRRRSRAVVGQGATGLTRRIVRAPDGAPGAVGG